MTKQADKIAARDTARDALRAAFPRGSTVTTVVRHVSSSGMQRAIVVLNPTGNGTEVENLSWQVARALEWGLHPKYDGVKVNGTGMDMTFHLVYTLAMALYGDGYALTVRNIA